MKAVKNYESHARENVIEEGYDVPVLILMFNRSDNVSQVVNALRDIKAKYVYIAGDGPRSIEESHLVFEARKTVLNGIDWDCEVVTLFQETNLGCRIAVHTALQWYFSLVNEGIVLEDDCIPSESFFGYMRSMLNIYRENEAVGSISGRQQLSVWEAEEDHFFSRRFFCWGWASWSDRIIDIDINESKLSVDSAKQVKTDSVIEYWYLKGSLGLVLSNQVNSWAYIYDYKFREKNQLCILPGKNMITNIGFDQNATHTKNDCIDTVKSFNDKFSIFRQRSIIEPDSIFTIHCLQKEFGSKMKLFIFSLSRHMRIMRKIIKYFR